MKTKITSINNPLTMIAVFVGISEVSLCVTLIQLPQELQAQFIWFVMFFPLTLVAPFFVILWKKPAVLFAPSDYQKDSYYLDSITPGSSLSAETKTKVSQLEDNVELLSDTVDNMLSKNDSDAEILHKEFELHKQSLTRRHVMQENPLYLFLARNIGLSDDIIFEKLKMTPQLSDFVSIIKDSLNDDWKVEVYKDMIEQFPESAQDLSKLIEFAQGDMT